MSIELEHTSILYQIFLSDRVDGNFAIDDDMSTRNWECITRYTDHSLDKRITLAESTNCILIDRDTLAEWVNEFQTSVS